MRNANRPEPQALTGFIIWMPSTLYCPKTKKRGQSPAKISFHHGSSLRAKNIRSGRTQHYAAHGQSGIIGTSTARQSRRNGSVR